MSYCHRISAGASVSDRPIRSRRTTSRRCVGGGDGRAWRCVGEIRRWRWRGEGGGAMLLCDGGFVREERECGSDSGGGRQRRGENERCEKKSMDRTVKVMVATAVTVILGVGNRVLYKLALVPLKHYPIFLTQLATFGYFYQTTRTAAGLMPWLVIAWTFALFRGWRSGNKERRKRQKVDEGIFGFSKVIVGDNCPGGPICHVHVTCCTILSILMRFWPQGVTAVQLD